MKLLEATINTGFAGCIHELVTQVPDNYTREAAKDVVMTFLWNEIELHWNEEDFIPANKMVYKPVKK